MKSWKNVRTNLELDQLDPCTVMDGIPVPNVRVEQQLSNAIDQLSALTYLFFHDNKFTGPIPESLGLVHTLQSLRLDQNKFVGPVPNSIGNLYDLMELSLVNNAFRGPLNMRSNISSVLRLVNLTNNQITEANIDPGYNVSLILTGNPICLHTTSSCTLKPDQKTPSGTGLGLCGDVSCPSNQSTSPVASQSCGCTTSFQGVTTFFVLTLYLQGQSKHKKQNIRIIRAADRCKRKYSSWAGQQTALTALQALIRNWQNEPQSWAGSSDPCTSWDGISCSNGRVTEVRLAGLNLQGTLSNAIDQLSALTYLDLSNNPDLGGPLTPNIGNLKELTTLFSGNIPQEIGNLAKLTFLALNSNEFTGEIPPTLGLLSNLIWLDLSDNQLSGQIPISPGLNQLVNAQHLIFDNNKFNGPIPRSLGFVPNLTIIRLDQNQFSGPVPKSIGNLRNLMELDLSNNDFTSSPAPPWFSELTSLNTLFMDNDRLTGSIPSAIFSLPELQQVSLAKNAFNTTLDMRGNISSTLRVVNLTRNQIITADVEPSYSQSLILTDNPVCLDNNSFCRLQKHQEPYATSLDPCGAISCPFPSIKYLSLERGSIALSNVQFGPGAPLTFTVKVFPVSGTSFNRSDVIRISSALVNQAYRAPRTFGPYSFIASAYFPSPSSRKSSMSNGAIIGIAIAGFILIAGLVLVAIYALRQKRIAKEAVERTTNPFASWGAGGKDNGDAPQLKGARYFSFDELKKCTSNFSQIYEIGSGGYGKGYLDPEYYMTQQLSEKSDVYSFGVVMLELVTARQPIEKGRYIVREIKTAIDQYDQQYYGLTALIDPTIRDSAKLVGFRRFVQLAMECVEESAVDRPTMNDVVKELEIIIQNEGAESLNTKTLSADQFGYAKARDPYEGHLPMKDESSSSTFDYNSVYSYSAVEPK
ncbi:hypothetical protein PR202_gb04420 [Eleusine coracana subsp. coracana]|uniref:non-specific serine/threonine protein kinase n=1 Tax=Eleusine coracana subsp. coracana TaxID=191504 RepID=A0AAV5E4A1_ELECO|nr:hypothetical protein PR202_gb04420 [Eleusine coracana subsp. coracana]